MNVYSITLFLHIVGVLGLFVSLGLEWASLAYLPRASTGEQAREWLGLRGWVQRLGIASLVVILLSGFYMMATSWGWVGWIIVALGAMVLIAVLGATLTGLRTVALEQAAGAENGPISPAFRQRASDPLLWISVRTRAAIALGIVFLMVIKPTLVGSVATIVVAVVLGLISSLPMLRRIRGKGQEALSRP